MVKISRCGFCKHYKENIKGVPICDAFTDGQPSGFEVNVEKKCKNGIGFEVKEDLKEVYNKFY